MYNWNGNNLARIRIDKILFLSTKKKKKTRVDERFDSDDEECEKEVIYRSSRAEFLVAC